MLTPLRPSMLAALLCCAISCDSPVGVNRELVTQLDPAWVGGAASTQVDWARRQFVLPGSVAAVVPLARAESLATALSALLAANALIGNVRETLQFDRGAPISFNDLSPCRRATYTISPANADGVGLSPYQRRRLANQWSIPLCNSRGDALVSVTVADSPIAAQIFADDIVWESGSASGAFSLTGMRPEFPSGLPLSPEEAAGFLYGRFGTRLVDGPELVVQYEDSNFGRSAHCGSWRFVLENAVEVPVANGGALTRDVFYVRRHPACISDQIAIFVERDSQPETFWSYRLEGAVVDSVLVDVHRPTRFIRILPE